MIDTGAVGKKGRRPRCFSGAQVKEPCEPAGVGRSGHCKRRERDGAPPDAEREGTLRLVEECHEEHPGHGYRRVHAYISQHEEGFSASADYVRRCSGHLGISAETRRMAPDAFYGAFAAGDVERKDTFAGRAPDPTPKSVRERPAAAEEAAGSNGGTGSSDPAPFDRRVHDAA